MIPNIVGLEEILAHAGRTEKLLRSLGFISGELDLGTLAALDYSIGKKNPDIVTMALNKLECPIAVRNGYSGKIIIGLRSETMPGVVAAVEVEHNGWVFLHLSFDPEALEKAFAPFFPLAGLSQEKSPPQK